MTEVRRYAHGSRVPGWDEAVDLEKPPAEVPEAALTPVPEALRAEIEELMSHYPDRRSAVIGALHAAQRVHGWSSPEAIEQVAAVLMVTPAYVDAIATFYDMFETEGPRGDTYIYVCTNISCGVCGSDPLYAAFLEAAVNDENINVRQFECLGACDMAPMASVNGVYIGPLVIDDVPVVLEQVRAGQPILPDKQVMNRKSTDGEAVASLTHGPPPGEDGKSP
jgi:NADH:ubiquinone oxidoreductase subunit E